MRSYLGEDPEAPIRHPLLISGFGLRVMGLSLPMADRATAAIILSGLPHGLRLLHHLCFLAAKVR